VALADNDELLRRCQRGDDSAMRDLVQSYQGRIFRLAYRVFGDSARAEEVTADALATVWERCRSWRGESQAGTWIHRVAWRVILDHQRSLRRWWRFWELDGIAESPASQQLDPSTAVAEQDERAAVTRFVSEGIGKLPVEDRALIHMHYYEQQSLAEIAVVLGVSRDALKMRLSRARQKLRVFLGDLHE